MTLFNQIGATRLEKIMTDFYQRAFADPIIGHFFLRIDQDALIKQQIAFATNLLGGPKIYVGKNLDQAHSPFTIRKVHFDRRQVLLKEVLCEHAIEPLLMEKWLIKEEKLRPLILTSTGDCHE